MDRIVRCVAIFPLRDVDIVQTTTKKTKFLPDYVDPSPPFPLLPLAPPPTHLGDMLAVAMQSIHNRLDKSRRRFSPLPMVRLSRFLSSRWSPRPFPSTTLQDRRRLVVVVVFAREEGGEGEGGALRNLPFIERGLGPIFAGVDSKRGAGRTTPRATNDEAHAQAERGRASSFAGRVKRRKSRSSRRASRRFGVV